MNSLFKIFFSLKEKFKKVRIVFKGSSKDPFFYLGVISVVLFGILSFAPGPILKSSSNQGDLFFLAEATNILPKTFDQDLFLNPTKKFPLESPDLLLVQKNSLRGNSPPVMLNPQVLGVLMGVEPPAEIQKEITEYIVEPGDSLWSLSRQFNISLDTLVWANNLKNEIIKPGQKLLILPVSGVMHLVKEGDTISEIAKKYKADPEKIIAFNDLSDGDDIFIGEVLIIPDGKLPFEVKIQPTTPRDLTEFSTNNFYGQSHAYPEGYCTWWVAQKRAIPSLGNAKNWLNNAMAAGLPVCTGRYCVPKVGAVICLKSSNPLGHVGYVEEIKGDKVIFSEMNYIGWGKMNYRTLRIDSPLIKGYIY